MKLIKADLLADVVTSYDQTKTTLEGRITQKTISGVDVLGPISNKFIDVLTDTGFTPGLMYISNNNRLFVTASAPTNAPTYDFLPVFCYDFNLNTGEHTYIGRIDVNLPNLPSSTHTLRGFKVYNDATNTGWKIAIATTSTVTINGGLFLVNNIDKADFIPIGSPTIPMATTSNDKAVYLLQDPANIGVNQLNIASAGMVLDKNTGVVYVHNGISATHQYYLYDLTAAPTLDLRNVSVNVASPGVVSDSGHTYNNNDPVIFTAGTLPTGLSLNTVYFVRNPIAGVSYNLSLTSGGPSINTTGSPSVGAVITRAWGTTGSNFIHKTGNLPALTGTLLANDSEDFAIPGHTTNAGTDCVFFSTSSNLYLGQLADLTSNAVTWPSLVSVNQLGAPNEIINANALVAAYSNSLDKAIFSLTAARYVVKPIINNQINKRFGTTNISALQGASVDNIDFGTINSSNIEVQDAWAAINSTTTGTRGIFVKDIGADSIFDNSYIVTKVLDVKDLEIKNLTFLKQFPLTGGSPIVFYRTSGFSTITGGWTPIDTLKNISIASANQIQFKITFDVLSKQSTIPEQINELLIAVESPFEISNNWEFSDDFSDNTVPSRTAFRLKKLYTSTVPTLNYKAYDLNDVLLINHNTVTNAANFEYSTDNGTSWIPLGTIPNVIGTLIRYTFTSPPGVDIRPALTEV